MGKPILNERDWILAERTYAVSPYPKRSLIDKRVDESDLIRTVAAAYSNGQIGPTGSRSVMADQDSATACTTRL